MRTSTRDKMSTILRLLTESIHDTAEEVAGEAYHPGLSVDDSEDVMRRGRDLVKELRQIRQQVEDLTLVRYL